MIVEKKTLRIYLGMLLICLFAFTTGLHPVLFGGLNNAILVLLFGILLVWNQRTGFLHDGMAIWACILVAIMLFNNKDNQQFGTIMVYNTLAYMLAWLFYIFTLRDNRWHKPFLKLCILFGLFHAVATWFFKIVPSFYSANIVPLLGTWGDSALREFQNGWAPGISPTYSTNAVYIAFGFCTAVGLLMNEFRTKRYIPVLICISALLLTGKRSQLIVSVFAFLLMYYLYNSDKKTTRIFKLCGIAIVSLVIFNIASQFVPELANFINRFRQTAEMGDVTLGRAARFAESMQIFLSNPILGIGWNGSAYYFEQSTGIFINVHNIYIQILCETGIIGTVFYFTFFIYNYIIAWRMLKRVKQSGFTTYEKAEICAAFMIETFTLLYGVTGNPIYDFQTLFPYVASCGIITYYNRNMNKINFIEGLHSIH